VTKGLIPVFKILLVEIKNVTHIPDSALYLLTMFPDTAFWGNAFQLSL
jgi:hypothetical protein